MSRTRPVRLARLASLVVLAVLTVELAGVTSSLPSAKAESAADPSEYGPQLRTTGLQAPLVVRTGATATVGLGVENPSDQPALGTGTVIAGAGWDPASLNVSLAPGQRAELRIPVTAPERPGATSLTPRVLSQGTPATVGHSADLVAVPAAATLLLDAGTVTSVDGFSALTQNGRLTRREPAGWRGRGPEFAVAGDDLTGGWASTAARTLQLRTGPGQHTVGVLTGSMDPDRMSPTLRGLGADPRTAPGGPLTDGWRWNEVTVTANAAGVAEVELSAAESQVWQINAIAVTAGPAGPPSEQPRWVGAWFNPAMGQGTVPQYPDGLTDATVRTIAHSAAAGEQVRVRVSNAWGERPLTVGRAAIAPSAGGSAVDPSSQQPLSFDGRRSVVVAPGADVLSDPVDLPVRAGQNLAVSLHLPERADITWHQQGLATHYLATGDRIDAGTGNDFRPVTSSFFVTAVDVRSSEHQGTIVTLGDSITDGVGSTLDGQNRYPDYLARRLARQPQEFRFSVVNAGIGGNRLLTNSRGTERFHDSALRRFDADVLAVPGVTAVVVLLGTNDLATYGGNPDRTEATLADFQAAYQTLVERAEAAGVEVIGVTIPPGGGPGETEPERPRINDWIRDEAPFAAVLDAFTILDDPDAPGRMRPDLDSGDNVHPGDAGYELMAKQVPLPAITGTDTPQPVGTADPRESDGTVRVGFAVDVTSPDGAEIVDVAWDFGDGGTAIGARVEHTYPRPGNYVATVTATDSRGRQGIDLVQVVVTDPCGGDACSFTVATDDTFVRNGTYADDNHGSEPELNVKTASAGFTRQSLLRFDLTGLTLGTGRALLRIRSGSNPDVPVRIDRTATSWDEATVTWRTRPAVVDGPTASFSSPEPGWTEVDITELVRASQTEGADALSLSLSALATANGTHTYLSSESSDGALAPKLVIVSKERS